MMATATISPTLIDSRLERSLWYMGGLMTIHLDAKDTDGALALVEVSAESGGEPPLHVHENEDEMFYVLEGSLQVTRGSEQLVLGPGESGFLPRGVPHTFKILSDSAKALVTITPAGFEEYFRAIGRPAEALGPDPNPAAPDIPHMIRVCESFGVKFVDAAAEQTMG